MTTVTRIGDSAFSGCVHLVHIVGTSALTEIGNSAFYGCSKLVGIDLPDELIEKVVDGVKAKITLDKLDDAMDLLGGLFGKK